MREIKFRAWDKETSTMVDLKKVTPLALDANLNQEGLFIPFDERYILMQYIGVKDVNGREVYEGDIVKCSIVIEQEVTLVVALVRFEKLFPGFAIDHRDGIDLILDSSVEVIGNLYENPELVSSSGCA